MQLDTTLQEIYDFFKLYPEYKGLINVQTRFGYYPIEECQITAHNSDVLKIVTESGKFLKTSPDHLLYRSDCTWQNVKSLTISDSIYTFDGLEKIKSISKEKHKKDLYDIQVAEKHEFYANNIVSHNSSMTEALVYALYGQTRNNIKNGNMWNKYVGSMEMRVVAYFNVDDNTYKVASGFNKYGAPYCHLFEIVDKEEKDITKSSILETRKFIANEVLHCDIDIFLRTILLTSDQNYNFFRLSKSEKKQFIEKLFDTSVFGDIYNSLHREVLDSDKTILSKQNRLLVLNNNAANYKERIEKFESDKKSKLSSLNESMKKLSDEQDTLKNSKIAVNVEEVEKYQNAIDKLTEQIDKLNVKINEMSKANNKIDVAIHKLDTSKEQKNKIISKHKEVLDKLCQDCKKIFSDYYNLKTYADDIVEIDKKISVLNLSKIDNDAKSQELNKQITDFNNKISKANLKIKKLTEEAEKTKVKLSVVESKILTVKNDIDNVIKQDNPYDELFENNNLELLKETKELDDLSEKYKYLKFAENIVSQDTLRKFIIGDLVWLLNNKLKMYLTKFGAKYDVQFDSDMNYKFLTSAGEYEYDSFSAGERARIMIASCFAFRDFMYIRNSFSCNILILDEFIDGAIDSIAIESVLNLLDEFTKLYKQNIYVISHRKEIDNDRFNNIIQVVKTNNISKITYIE